MVINREEGCDGNPTKFPYSQRQFSLYLSQLFRFFVYLLTPLHSCNLSLVSEIEVVVELILRQKLSSLKVYLRTFGSGPLLI